MVSFVLSRRPSTRIGDRWTLLIVRELLDPGDGALYRYPRGFARDRDQSACLPAFSEMEKAGIIVREEAPPPIATTVYRLTPRGRELGR